MTTANGSGLDGRSIEPAEPVWIGQDVHLNDLAGPQSSTSVYVNDQDKALRFFAEVLGFARKADFSRGSFRWLTVTSPRGTGRH